MYTELFSRNYGIFTDEEQERLRRSHILIVGCGGIGGTVAHCLARSGVGRFTLIDFDTYEPTNSNRQMACFSHTMGQNKARAVKEQILAINPDAEVTFHEKILTHEEIEKRIPTVDIVFPAADDLAFSTLVFDAAYRLGKPALFIIPSATHAYISIIRPGKATVHEIVGVPRISSYNLLSSFLASPEFKKLAAPYYVKAGWRKEVAEKFKTEKVRPPQICPVVWTASSIGSFEVVKLLSKKWKPAGSPQFIKITHKKIAYYNLFVPSYESIAAWLRKAVAYITAQKFLRKLEHRAHSTAEKI